MNKFFLILTFLVNNAFGFSKELPFPKESQSLTPVVRYVSGVTAFNDRLYLIARNKAFYLSVPFFDAGKSREERFGTYLDAIRHRSKGARFKDTSALYSHKDLLFLMDGWAMEITQINSDHDVMVRRSIVWDRSYPPSDRGGEAPFWEIKKHRISFENEVKRTLGERIVGVAKNFHDGVSPYLEYLLATRIKRYPLVKMICQKDVPSVCEIQRVCNLERESLFPGVDIMGIGTHLPSRTVVIGNRREHKLEVFHFQSCFHVEKIGEWRLPSRLKQLSSVSFDAQERLFVTTAELDDYTNASVFFWPKKDWFDKALNPKSLDIQD